MDKGQILSIGRHWPEQLVGKTAHCAAGIIEIFSGRAVLNEKGDGAVCACVCACVCLCIRVQKSRTSMSATADDTSMNE